MLGAMRRDGKAVPARGTVVSVNEEGGCHVQFGTTRAVVTGLCDAVYPCVGDMVEVYGKSLEVIRGGGLKRQARVCFGVVHFE